MPRAGAPAVRKAEMPRLEHPARHAGEDDRLLELHAADVAEIDIRRVKCDVRERRSHVSRRRRSKPLSADYTGR